MKLINTFLVVLTLAVTFSSCGSSNDSEASRSAREELGVNDRNVVTPTTANPAITPPTAQNPEPAQNAVGVWHYTCSNGCEGGGGSATACGTCGSILAHNTGYHTLGGANTTPTSATTPTPRTPEPAQNVAGVWHYTCGNGCEGGGGSASACGTCGSTLAHNTAYHN